MPDSKNQSESAVIQLFDHPYSEFLHKVEKPNRYTGAEHGTRRKAWDKVDARICLAFPDIYDIGMSHLGFRILYRILNDNPRTLAERCYTPWIDMQRELLAHGEFLRSLESARPLCDFDVVGFSLQFELTYTNILGMLELSGIPLRSEHRGDDDPLIIAGGPVATHAEPLALFVDAILIGDGEEAATEIALAWVEAKRRGLSRQERLVELSAIRGVYVPSLYTTALDPDSGFEVVSGTKSNSAPLPIERRLLEDLNRFPFPDDGPVGGPEAIFDRMSIEVARGCTEGCRFCQAGMIYRPVRERDPEQVVGTVLDALDKSGQDEVSLTALSTADVSCISPMIKRLVEKTAPERVSLSVASLRAYGLAEDLLDDMRKVRAQGLTFAPEAGTQRMRDVINKNVTEAQLLETAERVFSRGFDKMKLYFILGLPTEEDEDVLGIADVGRNALQVGKRLGKRPKVTVSVSTHVPKPHTPFQWCSMNSPDEVRRKQRLLKNAVRGSKGLQLRVHDSETSVLEGILARGDRRLGAAIERAFLRGARFDSWEDQVRLDLWQEAFEHFGIETSIYLDTIALSARTPWDHIDVGLEDGFLAREYQKALKGRLSPPCGKAKGMFVHHTNVADAKQDGRRLVCYDCGIACDLTEMRESRVVKLHRMGALEPGQRARLPILDETGEMQSQAAPARPTDEAAAEAPPSPLTARLAGNAASSSAHEAPMAPKKAKPRRPEFYRPPRTGGAPVRVRLRFQKTGPAALLGHLDVMRELPRVIRRAGIKTAYTEGFHPKPDVSFGPALALGIASLDEYVDMKLIGAPEESQLVVALNRAASSGLRFIGAASLDAQDPGLSRILTRAVYVLGLPETALSRVGGVPGLTERIAAFLAETSVKVRRDVKGIGKMIDVRAMVTELRLGDIDDRKALNDAGVVGRLVPVRVALTIGQQGSARLVELMEALLGDASFPFAAVRTALLATGTSPLELGAHRLAPRSKADKTVQSVGAG